VNSLLFNDCDPDPNPLNLDLSWGAIPEAWSSLANLPQGAQASAAFVGSLALMVGTEFGAEQVLPTLLASHAIAMIGPLFALATLLLCAFSVSNVVGKGSMNLSQRWDSGAEGRELQSRLAVLTAMLAIPGLGGAYLLGAGTTAWLGGGLLAGLFGLVVGLLALASIAFTAWTAADPEPVLPQLIRQPRCRASQF
jgi:hypothetical protein